ncbi:Type II secretion system protein F [Thalassocella blandensis]|nr:Type II secretion system protein F [Thalassocella blandensis]
MPNFKFQGRSEQGQAVTGTLEASSKDAVAGQLMGRGVTPIKIEEETAGANITKQINTLLGGDKVSTVDLIMFCRQMYTITKAGIPLTRGIRGLAAGVRHQKFQEVLNDVAERLEGGTALSRSLRAHPKIFNDLFVSMINVGETSGNLDQVFKQIGYYIERDEETKKRVKSALRYPTFVVMALAAAIAAINVWVVPAFAKMFSKFDAELPIVTKILIGTSNVFVNYWYLIGIVVALGVFGFLYLIKTEKGKLWWGKQKLNLPIVGELIERASMARYARSFSLMLQAGVPINRALSLCAASIDNAYLGQKIARIREGVERGDSLLRTHNAAQIFTPLVLQMIAVGEESGQIEELLGDVAEFYDREVDYDLQTLTDKIEPILIITMAIFVTILALGIFLPMWSMYDIQK